MLRSAQRCIERLRMPPNAIATLGNVRYSHCNQLLRFLIQSAVSEHLLAEFLKGVVDLRCQGCSLFISLQRGVRVEMFGHVLSPVAFL